MRGEAVVARGAEKDGDGRCLGRRDVRQVGPSAVLSHCITALGDKWDPGVEGAGRTQLLRQRDRGHPFSSPLKIKE